MNISVFRDYQEVNIKNLVLTIGVFDGLHLGHKAILDALKQKASELGGQTGVLTFHPHPRLVLNPQDNSLKLLHTLAEKIDRLETLSIQNLILLPFTEAFSQLSATEFIEKILVKHLKVSHIAIGHDHHFGKDRAGNLAKLTNDGKKYGFSVSEIPAYQIDEVNISSTKIRESLLAGDAKTAQKYLGYNYSIRGKVVQGDQIGRKIGFPTANILPEEPSKLIPAAGVYAVFAIYQQKKYPAVLNIGIRPTFNGKKLQIEAHLFDFNETIYDQPLTIEFIEFVRPEQRFEDVEALKLRILQDIKISRQLLASYSLST